MRVNNTNQIQEHMSKTQCKTKSVSNFRHKRAHGSRIYVSFGSNQQPAYFCVTIIGSAVQRGPCVTRAEIRSEFRKYSPARNQKQISNMNANPNEPGFCINVAFEINQQLAHECETATCSHIQSGPVVARTENQRRISRTQHNTK